MFLRYIVVTKSFTTTTISLKQTYIAIACAYSFAFFWTMLPLLGWSYYDYEVREVALPPRRILLIGGVFLGYGRLV